MPFSPELAPGVLELEPLGIVPVLGAVVVAAVVVGMVVGAVVLVVLVEPELWGS